MNETQVATHTPGPWEWHQHEDDKERSEWAPGYLFAPTAPYSVEPGHVGKPVIHAIYPSSADKYVRITCAPEDARLIAAAPDLLDFAVEFQEKAHRYGLWIANLAKETPSHSDPIECCTSPGCIKARNLIAKATAKAT